MAFFSDALAHCAFAGVSIGFLLFEAFLAPYRPAPSSGPGSRPSWSFSAC